MKKFAIFMLVAIVIGICVGLALPRLFPEVAPKSPLTEGPRDVLAGLVGCLLADVCNIKRTTEEVQGRSVFGVYHRMPNKGMNIKYVLQPEAGAMTVVVVVDEHNQLSIGDADLDGVADMVIEVTDGKVVTFGSADPSHYSDYLQAQLLYEFALQTAWDHVIPPNLRKHLKQNPDIDRFRS